MRLWNNLLPRQRLGIFTALTFTLFGLVLTLMYRNPVWVSSMFVLGLIAGAVVGGKLDIEEENTE